MVYFLYFRYYQFDSVVVREILGKKLSSRNRKDMDDVGEKTRIPLRSCRRQVSDCMSSATLLFCCVMSSKTL